MSTFSHDTETFSLTLLSPSADQTRAIGVQLGSLLRGGDLLLLDGQLGAGKTTFTQGLAQGMRITATVSSPTFTLLKEYQAPALSSPSDSFPPASGRPLSVTGPALYHFDLYRLDEPDEIFDLGFEDYFFGSGVSVVEWAAKADQFWPSARLYINLQTLNEEQRRLSFVATGTHYCELLRQFQKNTYATARS